MTSEGEVVLDLSLRTDSLEGDLDLDGDLDLEGDLEVGVGQIVNFDETVFRMLRKILLNRIFGFKFLIF